MIQRRDFQRRGIGLLEVIVCTGMVALMILPLAAVIRSSGQALADVNGFGSTSEKMRDGLRYVSELIRGGEIKQINEETLTIDLASGQTALVRVRLGRLEIRQGGSNLWLMEDVERLRFIERKQSSEAGLRSGIEIHLFARDPVISRDISMKIAVAIPPQV